MMEDIYPILAKHFLKQTSPDEEKLVFEFRESKAKEYALLKTLWFHGTISVTDFDSRRAWEEFNVKRSERPTKIIPLSRNLRKMAAMVAFLITGALATWYVSHEWMQPKMILVENRSNTTLEQKLADGSTIWLNRGAAIFYPKKFGDKTRDVSLKGEAFFEVEKDSLHPFTVKADYSTITVLGTSFNIDTDNKHTEVTVRTGKVEVASKALDKSIVLLPDQSALATEKDLTSTRKIKPNYLAWKTGVFRFADSPITEVIEALNTYYDNRLSMAPNKVYNCNLTAQFDKAPLNEIVEIIELTCDVSVTMENDKYTIE